MTFTSATLPCLVGVSTGTRVAAGERKSGHRSRARRIAIKVAGKLAEPAARGDLARVSGFACEDFFKRAAADSAGETDRAQRACARD